MSLEARALGRTGIVVSALGLGGGPLGDGSLDDASAERLLRRALDLGVTTVDTAPSYGESEPRIGRALVGVRERTVLVTKGGYGVPGEPDWTPRCITLGIERALRRLRTDRVDVFLLHSCDRDRLARGDLQEALQEAKTRGLVRAVGYSGDGDALAWAVRSGAFDVIECSVNVVDRAALRESIPLAASMGIGVLAKRALAGAAWRFVERPERPDLATYWDRFEVTPLPPHTALDQAARFAAFAPGVACALVGTRSIGHLEEVARAVTKGALAEAPREAEMGWAGVT